MKIANTVWEWGLQSKQDFEQAVKEISDLGYDAVENFNPLVRFYEDSPEEFDELMRKYNMEFVNLYHYLQNDFEDDFAMAERCCKFLQKHGAKLLNMQAPWRPGGDDPKQPWLNTHAPTKDDLDDAIRKLTRIGKLAKKYGITMCLHPHWGTMVEREDETAYVLERIDSDIMKLTLDTAHTTIGGMDPVTYFAEHVDRVGYVHLKDVILDAPDPRNPMTGFRELGRGVVDFRGVVKVLKEGGFDGVLCVELDNPRVCNYKGAMISRRYIREELGM